MKTCTRCKLEKSFEEFTPRKSRRKAGGPPTLNTVCRKCRTQQTYAWRIRTNRDAPKPRPGYSREHLYGLSETAFKELVTKQRNLCKICECEMGCPHVDHCHQTGAVRGLLCQNCNTGIGMLKDSPERLRKALDYLSDHGAEYCVNEPATSG